MAISDFRAPRLSRPENDYFKILKRRASAPLGPIASQSYKVKRLISVCSVSKPTVPTQHDRTPFYWRPIGKQSFYFPMQFTSDFLFFVLLSPPISGDFSYKPPKNGKPAIKNQSFHLESSISAALKLLVKCIGK